MKAEGIEKKLEKSESVQSQNKPKKGIQTTLWGQWMGFKC